MATVVAMVLVAENGQWWCLPAGNNSTIRERCAFRYAALLASKEKDGTISLKKEMKGLDMVRRDWCPLSKEAGEKVRRRRRRLVQLFAQTIGSTFRVGPPPLCGDAWTARAASPVPFASSTQRQCGFRTLSALSKGVVPPLPVACIAGARFHSVR
jgi:hypothetical protein